MAKLLLKSIFFSVILCFGQIGSNAQNKRIRLSITDENHVSIGFGSSILTFYNNNSKTTKLVYLDSSGIISFQWISPLDSVGVEINCLGFEITHLLITERDPSFTSYSLKPKLLEDIYIRAKTRIVQKKDTTRFNTAYFNKGNESTVEDAISQLPGVTVDEDGNIRFKNQGISKVLIDGDDLFGKNYKTLTKNLSASAIDNIDIIEHQNENKLLNGVVPGKQQVINLHLKNKNKIITELNTESGVGLMKDFHKPRYSSRSNLMAINTKLKSVGFANVNNLGDDPTQSLKPTDPLSQTNSYSSDAGSHDFISISENFYPGISRKRSSFNESKILSWNGLYKIRNNWNITPQLYLIDSRNQQKYENNMSYIVGNQTVVYDNTDTLHKDLNYKLFRLRSEWNPTANTTILYNGNFEKKENNTYGSGILQQKTTWQRYNNDAHTIQNDIQMTHKINSSSAFEFEWFNNQSSHPQFYKINNIAIINSLFTNVNYIAKDSSIEQNITQKVNEKTFELRFYKKWDKYSLQLYGGHNDTKNKYGLDQKLNGDNNIIADSLHKSDIRQNKNYMAGKLSASITNKINYTQNFSVSRQSFYINTESSIPSMNHRRSFFENQSMLNLNTGLWTVGITHIYKQRPPETYQLVPFSYVSDYRSTNKGTTIFNTGLLNSFMGNFSYTDYSRSMLLYNATIQYTIIRPNYLDDRIISSNLVQSSYNTTYPTKNVSTYGTNQHIEKYLDFASGNFYLDINYQNSQAYYLSNNLLTTSDITNRYFELGFKSAWDEKINLRTLISSQWNTLKNNTAIEKSRYNNNYFKSSTELYFYPIKPLVVNL